VRCSPFGHVRPIPASRGTETAARFEAAGSGQWAGMAGRQPEHRVRAPIVRQGWRTMTFIHWSYPPEVVRPLLPDDLELDVRDGQAWVSLTPFVLTDQRPGVGPSLGRWSTFPETNLRTYAVGPDGRDGLHFLDLEAGGALTAGGLRMLLDLPYHHARMHVSREPVLRYQSTRQTPSGAIGHDLAVEVGGPLAAGADDSLDHWLVGRWRAFGRLLGRRVVTPVEHEPWPLHEAVLVRDQQDLLADAGLPRPQEAPLVRFSPGVSVAIGVPRPVRAHPRRHAAG
jgi:uncharacterized protein